jgi:hypothetical protein
MQLSDMPREKISCKFSPIFFFFLTLKKCNMEKTSYARQDQT